MQRTLLLALALLLAAPAVSAQTTIGLRAGLNTSFWTGADANGTDPRLGATGGLVARYQATPTLGLQGEVLYSQKGVQDNSDGTYKLDYVDIPVLVRVGVPLSPFADAGVFAGPTVSIPVKSVFDYENDRADLNLDAKTGVGITFGADYYAGPVGVDLRYTAGLSQTFEDDLDLEGGPLDIKNQVFSVSLGYRFGG